MTSAAIAETGGLALQILDEQLYTSHVSLLMALFFKSDFDWIDLQMEDSVTMGTLQGNPLNGGLSSLKEDTQDHLRAQKQHI